MCVQTEVLPDSQSSMFGSSAGSPSVFEDRAGVLARAVFVYTMRHAAGSNAGIHRKGKGTTYRLCNYDAGSKCARRGRFYLRYRNSDRVGVVLCRAGRDSWALVVFVGGRSRLLGPT